MKATQGLLKQRQSVVGVMREALPGSTIAGSMAQTGPYPEAVRVELPLFRAGSYTKMVGQLQDAGNTTTLAHYLDLLTAAGMVTGTQKYAGQAVRQRASSPKLQVFNTAS